MIKDSGKLDHKDLKEMIFQDGATEHNLTQLVLKFIETIGISQTYMTAFKRPQNSDASQGKKKFFKNAMRKLRSIAFQRIGHRIVNFGKTPVLVSLVFLVFSKELLRSPC